MFDSLSESLAQKASQCAVSQTIPLLLFVEPSFVGLHSTALTYYPSIKIQEFGGIIRTLSQVWIA